MGFDLPHWSPISAKKPAYGWLGIGTLEAPLPPFLVGIQIVKAICKRCCRAAGIGVITTSILLPSPAFSRSSPENNSTSAASTINRTSTPQEAKLTFRVYNYARIDSVTLSRSEKVVDAIFEDVGGIKTSWVDCPLSKTELLSYPACQSRMGTTDLVLRILPRSMAAKLRHHNEPLGFAQICSDTESACELNVFYYQIDELATRGYTEDRILGYVIAHEVTHVLIGPSHSDEGIMRQQWTPQDLQRISLGQTLNFTNDQSKRLRQAALRRAMLIQEDLMQAHLLAQ